MARQPKSTVLEPIGEIRRFEMPFTAVPGRLVRPELGLRSIALRAGDHAPYSIDATLLDAPDHRLMRAGVWLAHRVIDGRGEWYLSAEQWTPWLPAERVEPMGHADLPDVLADLVRPFRRGAALGPVTALSCDREEFALRGDSAELIAVVRDDKVQIRAGGVVTTSYREVTITGVEGRLTADQLGWLTEVLSAVGGLRVDEFPTLAQRIGAPATGLSDFSTPRECRPGDSLESVWGYRLGRRMRAITYADLALRADAPGALADLREQLEQVRAQSKGFVPLLDAGWAEAILTELDWVLATLPASDVAQEESQPGVPDSQAAVLNGERYLRLLDQLMRALRAPALGDDAHTPAGAALADQLQQRLTAFTADACALTESSPDADWAGVRRGAASVLDSCAVQIRPGKDVTQLAKRTTRLVSQLNECLAASEAFAVLDLDELTSAEAFEAGRRLERLYVDEQFARAQFLDRWSHRESKIRTWTPATGRPNGAARSKASSKRARKGQR